MQRVYLIVFSLLFINVNGQERKNAIKLEPLSLTNNFLEIGLEHQINEFKTTEITIGIIGLYEPKVEGNYYETYSYKANGFFIKTNYKKVFSNFIKTNKTTFNGMYFSPEIAFANFSESRKYSTNYNNTYQENSSEFDIQALTFMFNLGAKITFKNRILLDGFLGIGSCFDNRNKSITIYNSKENNFIARRYFETNRFATQLGLKIGYLF
ncbi:MAG: hypothetical protein WCI53_04095 [Bacteroidota bacterium]|jgi:hypothetical protein